MKKNYKRSTPHMVTALAVTLVIATIYSTAIYFLQNSKFLDWLNTLTGSGISFFLAILSGIFLHNAQTSAEEKSNRESLVSLLTAELSDLIRILNDSSRMEIKLTSNESQRVLITFVQPLIIEKAALSGLFTTTESENLLHLARKLRMLNLKTEHLLGVIQLCRDEKILTSAIENIEQTRSASIEGIDQVAKQLGLNLSPST